MFMSEVFQIILFTIACKLHVVDFKFFGLKFDNRVATEFLPEDGITTVRRLFTLVKTIIFT